MQLFDTHAHLDDEQFDSIREEVVDKAQDAGLIGVIAVGTSAATSEKCVAIASQFNIVHAAVGIQPNSCAQAANGDWDRIVELANQPRVVALGETGLDRYWDYAPFELQQDYFDRHLRLSQQTGLPFIVHMRECEDDILQMLQQARSRGKLQGVMHSFTGSIEGAAQSVELGLYISFAGMVTFKKSEDLRAVAATVPDDHLLIETDSPYLSPHPKRGQRPNEPALVAHTAQCLAAVRGISLEDLAMLTTRNAQRLFRIQHD